MNPLFRKHSKALDYYDYPDLLEEGEQVLVTEKIHGTLLRAGWVECGKRFLRPDYEFLVGSRGNQHGEDSLKVYNLVARQLKLKKKIPLRHVVYGEIFGEEIQDLKYGRRGTDVRFFDVMHGDMYFDAIDAYNFFAEYGLKGAPICGAHAWSKDLVEKILENFDQSSKLDGYTMQEGVIIRPMRERTHPKLGRVMVKLINPQYLEKRWVIQKKSGDTLTNLELPRAIHQPTER